MNDPESARQIALRWFNEVWNERKSETIYELLASDSIGHQENNLNIVGPEPFAKFHQTFLETLPDLRVEVMDTIAEAGKVCVHWRFTGTHTGAALGLQPTGKRVTMRGMTWFRIEDGKIVEGWDAWNQQALFAIVGSGRGETGSLKSSVGFRNVGQSAEAQPGFRFLVRFPPDARQHLN